MSASPLRPVLLPLLGLLLSAPVASAILLAQAAPSPAQSSAYTLAGIDIFGNTKTPDAAILGVLSIKQGAEINPAVVTALDEKLRASGKFAFSRISSTGYGDHKSYLTVDVVEKGEEKRLQLNPAPTGSVSVPQDILDWVRRYEKASYEVFQFNPRRLRDLDAGHYLDSDAGLREYEDKMLEMVPQHYDVLVKALKEDRDWEKRAACATLLGWAKDKKAVILPLEAALKDPEVQVRTSAARSLVPIAYLAAHTAVLFPMDPVLEMVHYPTSADRTKAVAILLQLAVDPANHEAVIERAGGILVQMAGALQPIQREHSLILLSMITGEDFGSDVPKWKAWWRAQKAGTWKPPKKQQPPSPPPTSLKS